MSIYSVFDKNKGNKKEFDAAKWSEEKRAQREAAFELIDKTSELMATNPQAFQQYLQVQGQFDRYTSNNAILVSAQMPDATQLKSFKGWRDNRIYVNPDPTKVLILEPGKEYERKDGTIATSFNAKEVYDVSQTSARIKTEGMEQKPMRELLAALIEASPVKDFQLVDNLEVPAHYNSSKQAIFVSTNLSKSKIFNSVAKEIAAAIYDIKHNENRDTCDFKSYCVAYMLSHKYGVDTSEFSFEQLPPEFAEMKKQEFKSELNSMRDVLGEIHKDVYAELAQAKAEQEQNQER